MGLLSRLLAVPLLVLLFLLEAAPVLGEGPSSSRPVHIQADTLTYSKETRTYEGKGSVVVVQGPSRLEADEATLNVDTGQVTTVGRVRLNDGVHDIRGERLDFNFNTTKGVVFHGRLFVLEGNFTVDAQAMERLSEEQYRFEDASFTTCSVLEGETTPWQFKADKAELDVEGFLYARNATFCILDVPVFYSPVVLFPAKRERATGFLMPIVGFSDQQGFKLRQEFFWDISPSQDVAVTADYRGALGKGASLEYRYYFSRTTSGYLNTRLFQDTLNHDSRWDLNSKHTSKFSEDLQARMDINYLNDRNTFRVLSENVLQRVAVYQESQAYVTNRWDNQVVYGIGRYSQNLSFSNKPTVQTAPEIGYSLLPARLGGFSIYTALDTLSDSFYREEGVSAHRLDLFPRVWAPLLVDRYITVTPQAGFRETLYSRSSQSGQAITRELPYLSTSLDTRLMRRFTVEGGGAIVHKIEPAVIYEYIPPTSQDNLPSFNDVDRITKKNLVTYSLTNRLLWMDPSAGRLEFGYLRLTQSQHLSSSPTGTPFSDLRAELILRTSRPVSATLDIDTFYDHTTSAVSAVNTDLLLNLPGGWMGVGQRFTRAGSVPVRGDLFNPRSLNEVLVQTENTHFYSFQAGKKLPYNFYFVTLGYYDYEAKQFPQVNYGLYYVNPSRCWGAGIFLIQNPPPQGLEYAFVFTLGGVGFTDSPFNALYTSLFKNLGLDIEKLR